MVHGASYFFFDSSANRVTGSLPSSYGNWQLLQTFNASSNTLTGTLPPEYSSWKQLVTFSIFENYLTGILPPQYSAWSSLFTCNAFNNQLVGTLPTEYRTWTQIFTFQVSTNFLSGTMPPEYSDWQQIQAFVVFGNKFYGSLPPQYGSCRMLNTFVVYSNSFSGTLPPAYSSWVLIEFNVGNNLMSGTLPSQYASWGATLRWINVAGNMLTGTLPDDYRSFTSLQYMYVSHNRLSGTIPAALLSSTTAQAMLLSFNDFSGTVPSACSATLQMLDLQNNSRLSGFIPPQLQFGYVTVCGTQITCPTGRPYVQPACLPDDFVFVTTTADASVVALSPYAGACTNTPAPSRLRPTATQSKALPASPLSEGVVPATPTASSSAMMYAALVGGGTLGRGAVPGLQRATASLRLAALCANSGADDGASGDAGGSGSAMLADLADNPTGVSLAMGSAVLGPAAAAAVLNLVLVWGIGAAMHVAALVKHRVKARAAQWPPLTRGVLAVVPSALLPGAAAVTYGTLFQPSVGACVALVASSERSAGSVVCGVVMLAAWVAYPAYCVREVLWRGRMGGTFALSGVAVQDPRRTRRAPDDGYTGNTVRMLAELWRYATQQRERWEVRPGGVVECVDGGGERLEAARRVGEGLLRRMEAVFGAYVARREWFFAVEWALTVVSGLVLGVANAAAADGDACAAAVWGSACSIVFAAVHCALCVVLRPFSVRLEFAAAVLMDVLGAASEVLGLVGAVDAAGGVVSAAAIAELVVIAVMLVEFVRRKQQDQILVVPVVTLSANGDIRPSSTVKPGEVQRRRKQQILLVSSVDTDRFVRKNKTKSAFGINATETQLRAVIELICSRR